MIFTRVCVFATAMTSATALAGGNLVDLSFDALPSAQGYTYGTVGLGNGIAETDVFSVDGAVLTSDTMGQPFGFSPGSNLYRNDLSGFAITTGTMTLEIEARVLESQVVQFNYGFIAGMNLNGMGMSVGLMDGVYATGSVGGASFDTSDWHTYTLIGDLDAGTYELLIDGSSVYTGGFFSTGLADGTEIGDGTGTGNARVEIRRFEASASAVPTPGAAALAGLAGLVATRRRRG